MSYHEMIVINMLLNNIPKTNTGYIIIDTIIGLALTMLIINLKHCSRWISRQFNENFRFRKYNRLIFTTPDNKTSKRLKAIIHHISKLNNNTIRVLEEVAEWNYNRDTEDYEESKVALYRVYQEHKFTVDTNIEGDIYYTSKEKCEVNGRINYTDIVNLVISSKKLSLLQLQDWVEKKLEEYNKYIKSKSCDKQLLVEVGWNPRRRDLEVSYCNWASNATFENRFFTDKDKVLQKVNFFINNPEWYKERGIPYTLGFLLWGEPGCGKTGFIKALMNLTGRHGISVKLNNNFDMNRLREVIFEDEISDNLIIPQENRILIFEDVDCMSDIVKDRDIKNEKDRTTKKSTNNTSNTNGDSDDDSNSDSEEETTKKENNFNNNLSYFLNILDGLQECPGRIIIMTTNKPEMLDKALVRPGRIDCKINFTKATLNDIKMIIQFYWNINMDTCLDVRLDQHLTAAEVINICRSSGSYGDTVHGLNNTLKN